jgi:ElaB/YqjD/DUF883 family membrane-anchored ribosome-binding protein
MSTDDPRGSDAGMTVSDKWKQSSTRVREHIDSAREVAGDYLGTGREKVSAAYADARERTYRVAGRANEIVQEHPLTAAAAAVAAGAVIAALFPKGRAAMAAVPKMVGQLGEKAKDGAEAALHAIEDADIPASLKANASSALEGVRSAGGTVADFAEAAREKAGKTIAAAAETAKGVVGRK